MVARTILMMLVLGGAATVGAAAENLIHNGDVEAESATSPPPGWTLWGAQRWKDPAHFTRDTAGPHGGKACLRIHHPAGTAGYIVSSPEHAVRTQPGACLTVSFWARAERPGRAIFGFDAYESLEGYVGAPSPGFFDVEVDREWRRFEFQVHEGWDFFARRARFLLLVFKATADAAEEQTLWIDDVVASQAPSRREGRLLDRDALAVEPPGHGLRPGERLAFALDPSRRLREATRDAGGISFHRVAGWTGQPYNKAGEYVLAPALEEAVRELRLPMTRFYAVGDEPFSLEDALDKAAWLLDRLGIPQDHTVLEFERQGATAKLDPAVWARGVGHSRGRGYGFRHWEVTNEPYVQRAKAVFPTPDAYVEHFTAVAAAIRAVHPEGHVGLAIHGRGEAWGNYVLKRTAGHYDFVVGHFYCFVPVHRSTFEDVVLRANHDTLLDVLKVNALIRAYNPGRPVYQYDTEWGMHSGGSDGKRPDDVNRNGNIFGTLHRAVRLIYYTREEILRGASSWEMFTRLRSPGFGVLTPDAPDARFMIWWLYRHFNRHVGRWVLETDGTAPYHEWSDGDARRSMPRTPVLATLSADGRSLYLVAVNGSWEKAEPCEAALRGVVPARVAGVYLSDDDPEGHPLVRRREDFVHDLPVEMEGKGLRFVLPPHSAAFVTVSW